MGPTGGHIKGACETRLRDIRKCNFLKQLSLLVGFNNNMKHNKGSESGIIFAFQKCFCFFAFVLTNQPRIQTGFLVQNIGKLQ